MAEDRNSLIRAKILIVEEEKGINTFLKSILEANGFDTLSAFSLSEGLSLATSHCPDMIITNLGLPDGDGTAIIRTVRQWSQMPIIILSSHGHEREKVNALELGADDYIMKPFGTSELIARVKVAMRHASAPLFPSVKDESYTVKDLQIDVNKHTVYLNGDKIHMTQNEFKILAILARFAGKVVPYSHLIKEIWGPSAAMNNQILRVNIANIRNKIEKDPSSPEYIFTENGVGYRLAEE